MGTDAPGGLIHGFARLETLKMGKRIHQARGWSP